MPKPRQRVCLNQGLKLDFNKLRQQGFVRPGSRVGPIGIRWSSDYWGEIASGVITANMEGTYEGWFRIQLGTLDQWITLVLRSRVFYLPRDEPRLLGCLVAAGGESFLQSTEVGWKAGRIRLSVR